MICSSGKKKAGQCPAFFMRDFYSTVIVICFETTAGSSGTCK